MRAYTYQPAGDAYTLRLDDRPTPEPGPGQVRVAVKAAALNYRDLIALRNKAGRKVAGVVPCSDGAGVVSAGPESVRSSRPLRLRLRHRRWTAAVRSC